MKRNPFVIGLLAVGVLGLAVGGMLTVGLGGALDADPPNGGVVLGQVVPLIVCVSVGVLSLLVAALLAGIGWEFRHDREWTGSAEPAVPIETEMVVPDGSA